MNENKTPAPKGVYNCEFRGARRATNPKNAEHFVVQLRLLPTDCGVPSADVCEYFADLPLCFIVGKEYGFFDRDKGVNVKRKCTAADTEAAIKFARDVLPDWAKFCDELPEGSSYADAIKWFEIPHADVIVRAGIKEPREFDGKLFYDANLYAANASAVIVTDDFDAAFGKSLKAAGVKFGGGAKKPSANAPSAPVKPSAPVAPKKPTAPTAPAKPAAPAKVYTSEDAWNAYEGGERIKNDPQGAKFYATCAEIVGRDASTYETWTSADWQKCAEAFDMPF